MTQGKAAKGTARSGAVSLLNAVLGEGMPMSEAVQLPAFTGLMLALHGEWSNRTRHVLEQLKPEQMPDMILLLGRPRLAPGGISSIWCAKLGCALPPVVCPISVRAAIQKTEMLLSENASHQEARSRLADLTDRERAVMLLAVQGLPNKQIARQLGISHRTVEIHKSKIMHKTNALNLLDLARLVHESDSAS